MTYLLFTGFLVICTLLVLKLPFYARSGLRPGQLIFLFLAKVVAGVAYGYIAAHTASMPDTWLYHQNALVEYNLLFNDPLEYLTNLFHNPYEGTGGAFDTAQSYWNDLEGNVLLKVLSVFDIFSRGHYYTNVIFYECITLLGPVTLFKTVKPYWKHNEQALNAILFMIPSFIFWTSGIHKEGLIFTGLAMAIYGAHKWIDMGNRSWATIASLVMGLLITFLLRNTVFLLLSYTIIIWGISKKVKWSPFYTFAASIGVIFIVVLIFPQLFSIFHNLIEGRRHAVMQLSGNSSLPLSQLEPTIGSYMAYIPQAFAMGALRPYALELHSIPFFLCAIEVIVAIFLFLVMIVYGQSFKKKSAMDWAFVFFSLSFLLLIGFTNNNLGTVERYRSILWPLVIYVFTSRINTYYKKI